jgi:hypothetical protein
MTTEVSGQRDDPGGPDHRGASSGHGPVAVTHYIAGRRSSPRVRRTAPESADAQQQTGLDTANPPGGVARMRQSPSTKPGDSYMTTSTIDAPDGVDNYDWLEAVDQHPKTTTADLLVAYHVLGARTDRTPEQLDESTFRLHLFGFLRPIDISDDGRTYTYEFLMPEEIVPDSELEW